MDLPDPESLRCFLAAARFLNFRAAAQAVHLTPAGLGKRIQQLERGLGVALFHRTTRKVELTEAGLALFPRAAEAVAAAETCVRSARGEHGAPPVELTVGTRHELGLSWLLPSIPHVERTHPFLTLHLYFSSGPDLELRVRGGEIDCAVTSRPIEDPRLEGFRLHEEKYTFVGHPALLERTPLRRDADALEHTLIDVNPSLALFRYWQDAPRGRPLRFGGIRRIGTIAGIHWLVRKKQGVAVLPRYLVQSDLARGRLLEILPGVTAQSDWFRLIARGDDPRRSVFSRLAATLREQPLK